MQKVKTTPKGLDTGQPARTVQVDLGQDLFTDAISPYFFPRASLIILLSFLQFSLEWNLTSNNTCNL